MIEKMNSIKGKINHYFNEDSINWLFSNKIILVLLLIVNLAGSIAGFYGFFIPEEWYPIDFYHPIFWLLIADCPVYTALYIVFIFKRDWEWINGIIFIQLIKYGYTGSIVWLIYLPHLVELNSIAGIIAWGSHIFLIAEACLILPFFKFLDRKKATRDIILISSWVIFNEFMDFIAFDILSGLGLIQWESYWFMGEPHGTLALFPLSWNEVMPDLMFIFIIIDVLLFWIIYRRYTQASDREDALT